MKVKDIMTTAVRTVGPDTSLKEVAVLLSHHRISGLPVVDATGAVVGVVSKTDILRKESAAAGSRNGIGLLPGGDDPALALKVAARTAGEAMTAPAVTIGPESSVAAAATLMLELGIERLPVLEHGSLVGLVSRSDLVRAFTRPDAEIALEIHREVIEGVFSLPSGSVDVTVEGGIVQLAGELSTETDLVALPEAVRLVVGVVAVESQLEWRSHGP